MNEFEVHVYPVGALQQMLRVRTALNPLAYRPWQTQFPKGKAHPHWRRIAVKGARASLARHWRRRSYWNGYLTEPTSEAIYWTRCGHGWTKRRAMASLVRHVGEVQRDGYLRYTPDREITP